MTCPKCGYAYLSSAAQKVANGRCVRCGALFDDWSPGGLNYSDARFNLLMYGVGGPILIYSVLPKYSFVARLVHMVPFVCAGIVLMLSGWWVDKRWPRIGMAIPASLAIGVGWLLYKLLVG